MGSSESWGGGGKYKAKRGEGGVGGGGVVSISHGGGNREGCARGGPIGTIQQARSTRHDPEGTIR